MGSKLSNSAGLRLAGTLAIVLGVLLAVAAVRVGDNGATVLLEPRAEWVGVLALAFVLGGWGTRRRLPGARSLLAMAYVFLGSCQIFAAAEAFSATARAEHALFALWLWSGILVLWLHRRDRN